MLNIVEETAREIAAQGLRRPLLLGTRSTLRSEIYPRFGPTLDYIIPSSAHQDETTAVVMRVCSGAVDSSGRARLLARIAAYPDADSVVLGCTELPHAIDPPAAARPVFDWARILAHAAFSALVADVTPTAPPSASP